MRLSHLIAVSLLALSLSACPSVPPVVPIVDALYERATSVPADVQGDVADTERQPSGQATEFGPCESATDCLTYPNSASVCDFQTCALQCVPGFANCDRETDNGCEQSLSTPAHCGGCDSPCEPPDAFGTCATGVCLVAACNLGFGDCDGLSDNGCETLLVTVSDCGECGVPCEAENAEMTCDGGECAIKACLPGFGDCDDALDNGCETGVDVPSRCGGCEVSCDPGQGCAFDHCAPTLSAPLALPTAVEAIASAPDGAIYLIGSLGEDLSWPSDQDLLEVAGDSDVLLIKAGVEEGDTWTMSFGGLNTERAAEVVVDAEGRVSLTGTFQSGLKFDGALLAHTGGDDVFLLTLDAQGAPLWGLGLGGFGDESAYGLALGPNDERALLAKAQSPASFGGEVLTSDSAEELGVVALYTQLGSVLWARGMTSTGSLTLSDLLVDEEGEVHVLVTSTGGPLTIEGGALGEGPMVITWGGGGDFVGARPLELAQASALVRDGEGRLWVGGQGALGGALITRLDVDSAMSISVPSVQALERGPEGSLYVAGLTTGAFDVGLGPVVVGSTYAARYDTSTGEALWFSDLGALSSTPRLTRTPSGAALAGELLLRLDE